MEAWWFRKPKQTPSMTNIQVWPRRIVTPRGKTRRQIETLEDRMIPRSMVGVHRGPGRSLDSWCTPLVNQHIVERTFVTLVRTRHSFEARDRSCELTGHDHKNRRQTPTSAEFYRWATIYARYNVEGGLLDRRFNYPRQRRGEICGPAFRKWPPNTRQDKSKSVWLVNSFQFKLTWFSTWLLKPHDLKNKSLTLELSLGIKVTNL